MSSPQRFSSQVLDHSDQNVPQFIWRSTESWSSSWLSRRTGTFQLETDVGQLSLPDPPKIVSAACLCLMIVHHWWRSYIKKLMICTRSTIWLLHMIYGPYNIILLISLLFIWYMLYNAILSKSTYVYTTFGTSFLSFIKLCLVEHHRFSSVPFQYSIFAVVCKFQSHSRNARKQVLPCYLPIFCTIHQEVRLSQKLTKTYSS